MTQTRGRRVVVVMALAGAVVALLWIEEYLKEWLHPDITPWESHAMTVALAGIAVAVASYIVLRSRDALHTRIAEESEMRRREVERTAGANALLLATIEANRDAVLVATLDGRILTSNRKFLEMWGLNGPVLHGPSRDLVRHTKEQLSNPDRLAESIARLQSDEESESTDLLAFKDGRFVELFTAPQRLNGIVVGRVWRCRDVTAHRLERQHIDMLAQTIRSVSECVVVTNMENQILFVNQAYLDTFGFEESELLGHSVAVARSPRTSTDVVQQILPGTQRGGWKGEVWNRRKDGTDIQMFLSTSVVRDENGAPVALVGVSRDITEEKRTTAALSRARESDRIVTLAAGIAHQFNNLLQTVLAEAEFAREDAPPGSPARASMQAILQAGGRAVGLTEQLLAYAGRGVVVRIATVDLNSLIEERARFLRSLMPPDAVFELDLAPGAAVVRIDPQQIQHVLVNLVTNAAEAMAGRHGGVRVRSRIEHIGAADPRPWVGGEGPTPGPYVSILVEDDGMGMDAETTRRVFDPFFSTKFLGRGLGLPAVIGIVNASGGAIAVESTPGLGARVTVVFPHAAWGERDRRV